jgi:hypothetical protein
MAMAWTKRLGGSIPAICGEASATASPGGNVSNGPITGGLTRERIGNYVLSLFLFSGERVMIRAVVEEAAALASLSLFLGMIAIWAQVISSLLTTPTL